MKNNEIKEFAKLIAILDEIYDRQSSEMKTEIYFEVLKEYSIDTLKNSIKQMIKSRKYPSYPKPSEIIEFINGPSEDYENMALEQFVLIKNKIFYVGIYQRVHFDDRALMKTIEAMGGWKTIGMIRNDQWTWKEKEFIKYYNIYKKQDKNGTIENVPSYLAGESKTAGIVNIKTKYPSTIQGVPQIEEQDKSKSIMKELSDRIKNNKKKNEDKKNKS